MTLAQVAEAASLNPATLSKIERRLQGARVETYRRIAAALDADWRDLVEDEQ